MSLKKTLKKIIKSLTGDPKPEDFINKLLLEIHEENLKKQEEAVKLMEKWAEHPELIE